MLDNTPNLQSEEGEKIDLVGQSIEVIVAMQAHANQQVDRYQRAIEKFTLFLGRPLFFYLILIVVVLWIGENVAAPHLHWTQWDPPPFSWLQGLVTLGALLMSTVVLITQNRQGRVEQRRAQLDLQVNLMAEQKVAKLISLVEELRSDLLNVQNRHDPEAEAMKESADPYAVLSALEETLEKVEDTVEEEIEEIENEEAKVGR